MVLWHVRNASNHSSCADFLSLFVIVWYAVYCFVFLDSFAFVVYFFFFFSSRRRHTRYIGDWSSDVCSSDLPWLTTPVRGASAAYGCRQPWQERNTLRAVAERFTLLIHAADADIDELGHVSDRKSVV